MAGDTEDLVLSISADVRQMQRALDRITGDTAKTTAAIKKHFDGLGDVGGQAFDRVAANSNKAAGAVQSNAARINNAMKASTLQTGNLAAQLNDIGVQLAGGQSPFLIALQQGSQINQVLGQGGARAAVGALAGAFTSLINPVSLATIAIITLGGAAVQYFASVVSGGAKSEEQLKREADLIRQVAKEWGDALPSLKAYADERQKLADAASQKEATNLGLEEAYAVARAQVQNLNVDIADSVARLTALGASATEIVNVQKAFAVLDQAVRDETGGAEAAKAVHDALASAFNTVAIPATAGLADQFSNLATALQTAKEKADKLRAELAAVQAEAAFQAGKKNSIFTPLDPLGAFDADKWQTNRANATKSQTQLAAEAAAKSRAKLADEAEREAQAVLDLIDQLKFEQSLIGATNVEREQATALRRAGSAATAEQQEQIKGLIAATIAEKDAIKAQEDAYKTLQDVGKTAINGLATALADGKLEGQELLSILGQIVQQLLSMPQGGLGSVISSIFGIGQTAFAGGILSGARVGLFHKGGVVGAPGGQSRTVHPGVFAGAPLYHNGTMGAGLRSGEVPAILQKGEIVLPKGARSSGGGVSIDARTTINAPNADREGLARLQAVIAKRDAELPARVIQYIRAANKQNVKFG